MTDVDTLVRAAYPEVAEPDPARIWAEVEQRIRPRRRRRPWAAGILVAAALAAALALAPHAHHAPRALAPVDASAASTLRRLARAQAALPDLPPGSFLYSRGEGIVLAGPPARRLRMTNETWVALDGRARSLWRGDGLVTQDKPRTAALGEVVGMPVSQLRALPDDPKRLAQALAHGARGRDAITRALGVLLGPARPATRAAMLRALALAQGVRRLPDETLRAQRVAVFALRVHPAGTVTFDHELLLDAATGEVRGNRYRALAPFAGHPRGAITSGWTYTQAIVASDRVRR
jgi:hypothetical protein